MKRIRTYWTEMDEKKKRIIKPILGGLVGGVLGYSYYALVGCSSGNCPITSSPVISTFWGSLIGGFSVA